LSPLDDYSKASDATAANFSRMLVAAIQAQTRLLLPLIGQNDLLGVPIARADIDRVVTTALLTMVPELVVAAKDASITAATTPAARDAAIAKLAGNVVGTGADSLVPAYATTTIAPAKLPKSIAPTATGASAAMTAFTFTDPNNWFFRAYAFTADDNKVGTDGLRHYYDIHRQMSGGVVTEWGSSDTLARSKDVHWSGTAWRDCLLGARGSATPVDAGGNWLSYYCDGRSANRNSRISVSIENRLMADVIAEFRRFPGSDGGVAYSSWGPSNLATLGAATFPAGANVQYVSGTNIANGYRYDATAAPHTWASIAVAAGGDSRITANLACAATGTAPTTITATLEDMIAKAPGKPCVFGVNTNADGSSLNPSEGWGYTSLSLGTITNGTALPAGTGNYFSINQRIRVAFTGGNSVTYLSCLERRSDASTRNCTASAMAPTKSKRLAMVAP
jgi:trimeric autotransporter adhesin